MGKFLLCNALFIKRGFRKISFIFILIALPVLCYILSSFIKEETVTLKAGIYTENNSDITEKIKHNLIHNYESVVFVECSSLSELKDMVASNTIECGYVLGEDFNDKLAGSDLKNIVELYTSPGTFMSALTNEYVFSEIFREYVINELISYISQQDIFTITDIKQLDKELRYNYEEYLQGNETFSFNYIDSEYETIDNTNLLSSYVMLSIRGIIALVIMFAAFIGTFNLYKDTKCGIFISFGYIKSLFCKMSEIFSLTLIACISGLLSIILCGQCEGIFIEVIRLLVYAVICTVYCFIVHKIVPDTYTFAALIPVFVLGSILFCPIFFDISEIIPIGKYIAWLFLPRYFFIL